MGVLMDTAALRASVNVLIACEESQVECLAFRARGYNAFSCDVLPCSGGHPEWHFQDDAVSLIYAPGSMVTQHGEQVFIPRWDILIAHPPCTFLTKAGATCMFPGGVLNLDRHKKMLMAREFFYKLWCAPVDYVAIENPIPLKCAQLPQPTTFIDPTQFGHKYTKKTLFWLRGLPPLMPTRIVQPVGSYIAHCSTGRRSKSFAGVAAAMAEQWGCVVENDIRCGRYG